jgi:hypothetical protein
LSATPVAVLDANVLVPAGVRDVFLSIAEAGLFIPVWQGEIEEEVLRNASRLMPAVSRHSMSSTSQRRFIGRSPR